MLLSIAALIVVLGVLIFVHEAGHFIAAKSVGVQVLRFSLGFGHPILRFRRGETEYWLSWIPLGGYVKMAGLEDEGAAGELEGGKSDVAVDPARAFDRKPIWARIVVLIAGVTMNIILAFVLYTGIAAVLGTPQIASTEIDSVDTRALPAGAEALATLRAGDRVLRLNGDTIRSWNDLVEGIITGPGALRFEVEGRAEPLVVTVGDSGERVRTTLARALVRLDPPRLGVIEPGRPASRAGLKTGDLVVRANGDTIRSWNEMLRTIWGSPGELLHLEVLRNGAIVPVDVVPDTRIETDTASPRPRTYGAIGATQDPPTLYVAESFGQAVVLGARQTVDAGFIIIEFLRQLLVGKQSVRDLGGPILIGQLSGQVARLGVPSFLTFMAFFSVQLAVLNLLPIPVLDGGNLVFLIAEAVRGKPIDPKVRIRLLNIGFLVLIAIMMFAVGNDVLRIIPR
ncbi:MAG: RIP metalloprotease RseP [Gemmatimonadetes bacterium]|nr:RIP metalloprotease RseP [Gemmatimonadota bacterium]